MADEFVQAAFDDFLVLDPRHAIGEGLFQGQDGVDADDQSADRQGGAHGKEGIPVVQPADFGGADGKGQGIPKGDENIQHP